MATTYACNQVVEVSVIVPARNAASTLAATLESLAAQDYAGGYEVIVVDDGSRDETAELARAAGAQVVALPTAAGPARARNAGARRARGTTLAFTDADCQPGGSWLSAVMRARSEAELVQGAVEPVPGVEVRAFDRTLNVSAGSSRLYETANLAVSREVFDRVGGFTPLAAPGPRPAVPTEHFGEDVIFGWRARRAGARPVFAPDARVFHAVVPRGPRAFIRERRRLRYFPTLVREVPELRTTLLCRVFLSRRSAAFDLALVGVLLAARLRRPEAVLAAAPWALTSLRTAGLWRRSAWRENLALAGADVVGLAALVQGSIGARRIVL